MKDTRPILLLEDDLVDAMIVKKAFKELGIENRLIHLTDGRQAIDFLKDGSNEKPSLILLDLNMPMINGLEFLRIIKADEILKKVPVIVLTTSAQQQDVIESFRLGVAGYMLKSFNYADFVETVKTINFYWSSSELPCIEKTAGENMSV